MRTILFAVALALPMSVLPACGQAQPLDGGPVSLTASSPNATGWKATEVVGGLEHPWAVTWLPDGRALITERTGDLRLMNADETLHPDPIGGVPEVLALRQGGLLDVQLHPDFENNQLVYLSYAHGTDSANHTRVARGRLEGHELKDVEVIFQAIPDKTRGFHYGCRLLFLGDGTMLITIGEGAKEDPSQDMSTHMGKIVRIRDDGSPATDNPFHARVDAEQEIWTLGHRNPQGIARHPVTGKVYASEHGPRGGDELNLIEPGNNYGWPEATYGRHYHGPRVSDYTALPEMVDPLIVWTPCIAPSGLAFYTGDKMPEWQGDLFAGGLVLKQVRRIKFADDNETIVGQETLQFDRRIRDVRTGPDGYLYVLTDEPNGSLLRIEPE